MPEPDAHPHAAQAQRVAQKTLVAGIAITLLKFSAFMMTNSVAVLSDAIESILNIITAAIMLLALWYSNRPADTTHPYGHGKVEFVAVALEGLFILAAAAAISLSAVTRLIHGQSPHQLDAGLILLTVIALGSTALATYVYRAGKRYNNLTLQADAKHLGTDVITTLGVLVGLGLVRLTGMNWLDSAVAMVLALMILVTGARLLRQAIDGLMDRSDPEDDRIILDILQQEVHRGSIAGYHKVRHRHTGAFHWVDMHLQFDANLSVAQAHAIASQIEKRVEEALGVGNATTHLEPADVLPPMSKER